MKNLLKILLPKKDREPKQKSIWIPYTGKKIDLLNDDYHIKAYIRIYEMGRWSPPYRVVLSSKKRNPSKEFIELGDFYRDQIPPMVKKFSNIRIEEILEFLEPSNND